MNKINQLTLEFLYFCKECLSEEKFLSEHILFEEDANTLAKSLSFAKEKLKDVSSRQHQAFLNVKKYEALALEKLKTNPHRYKNNIQWMELQVNKIKNTAEKRIQNIDKAAESTKTGLRNTITNLEKQIASVAQKPVVKNPKILKKAGSKLGTKGKIGAAVAAASLAGGYAAYKYNKDKTNKVKKEDFDYSALLQYKK